MKTITTLMLLVCTLFVSAQDFTFEQITEFISSGDDKTEFGNPENLFEFKGELYFTVDKTVDYDKHTYLAKLTNDNSIETIYLLNEGNRSYEFHKAEVGDRLFFTKQKNTATELWWTEDLVAFDKIMDPFSGINALTPFNFYSLDGKLFYLAFYSDYSDYSGAGLFSCNSSDLKINHISKHSGFSDIEFYKNKFYYTVSDYVGESVVSKIVNYSEADGEQELIDATYAAGAISGINFTNYNDVLYFSGFTAETGSELFSFDGTNFKLIKDIITGANSSQPQNLIIHNNMLYFYTVDGSYMQLNKYDDQTKEVTLCTFDNPRERDPKYLCFFENNLFGNGYNSAYGNELFAYKNEIVTPFDVNPKASTWSKYSSNPSDLIVVDNSLWFVAKTSTNTNIYKLSKDQPTAITSFTKETSISIAPNPSTGFFNVTLGNDKVDGEVKIFDLSGKMVLSRKLMNEDNTVYTHELHAGMYIVTFTTSTKTYTQKINIK